MDLLCPWRNSMKRHIRLLVLLAMCSFTCIACGKKDDEEVVDTGDTTEQVAFDDVEVEDYTVLKYNELEVLAYEDDTEAQVMLGRMLEYGTDEVKKSFVVTLHIFKTFLPASCYRTTMATLFTSG